MTFVETGLAIIFGTDKNIFAVGVSTEIIDLVSLGTEELVGSIALLKECGFVSFH